MTVVLVKHVCLIKMSIAEKGIVCLHHQLEYRQVEQ